MIFRSLLTLSAAAAALTGVVRAQELLIPVENQGRVLLYDTQQRAISGVFLDGVPTPWAALQWEGHKFVTTGDGGTLLGFTLGGFNDYALTTGGEMTGLAAVGDRLFAANAQPSGMMTYTTKVFRLAPDRSLKGSFAVPGKVLDLHEWQGELLVTIEGSLVLERYATDGTHLGPFNSAANLPKGASLTHASVGEGGTPLVSLADSAMDPVLFRLGVDGEPVDAIHGAVTSLAAHDLSHGDLLMATTTQVTLFTAEDGSFTPLGPWVTHGFNRLDGNGALYVGTTFCSSTVNTTGQRGRIAARGRASISHNNLTLVAENLPAGEFGIFIVGGGRDNKPLADGALCVGSGGLGLGRMPVGVVDVGGQLLRAVNLENPNVSNPGVVFTPGSTWRFQAWFRDGAGSPTGANLTDGVEVTFTL